MSDRAPFEDLDVDEMPEVLRADERQELPIVDAVVQAFRAEPTGDENGRHLTTREIWKSVKKLRPETSFSSIKLALQELNEQGMIECKWKPMVCMDGVARGRPAYRYKPPDEEGDQAE